MLLLFCLGLSEAVIKERTPFGPACLDTLQLKPLKTEDLEPMSLEGRTDEAKRLGAETFGVEHFSLDLACRPW